MQQLTLFGDGDVTGSGQPYPWPAADAEPETETPSVNPDQLAFDDAGTEDAA